jgi:hypothetical protein
VGRGPAFGLLGHRGEGGRLQVRAQLSNWLLGQYCDHQERAPSLVVTVCHDYQVRTRSPLCCNTVSIMSTAF